MLQNWSYLNQSWSYPVCGGASLCSEEWEGGFIQSTNPYCYNTGILNLITEYKIKILFS
jgi:hypothetical protein